MKWLMEIFIIWFHAFYWSRQLRSLIQIFSMHCGHFIGYRVMSWITNFIEVSRQSKQKICPQPCNLKGCLNSSQQSPHIFSVIPLSSCTFYFSFTKDLLIFYLVRSRIMRFPSNWIFLFIGSKRYFNPHFIYSVTIYSMCFWRKV